MAGFDAELYLRTRGEEIILGLGPERHRPWDSPLLEQAQALVAIGAISRARARSVIDDYSLAEAVRSDQGHHSHHRMSMARAPRSRGVALKPRRVVPCNRAIEDSNGVLLVRHVTLSEDTTSLAITWRPILSGQSRSRRRGHMAMFGHGPGGPLQPQLTDDRGTSVGTGFGGGGSDEEWQGHLTADQPLAPDTAWIEIDGTRLELTGEPVRCDIKIEPLADEATAHRFLWRRLAIADFHGPPEIEGSIDALIAAGAVQPDDPVLGQIRAVQQAMPHHPGMSSAGHGGTRSLPEPWRSLFRRQGREDGPEGTLALSAVTPEFDGFSVAVSCLESRREGFGIEVDIAPGLEGHGPSQGFESRQLVWWAADERDNHHLGQLGSWSGGESYSSGEINFWPALRPKARQLSIMPTSETSRAVITVPLTWDNAQAGEREPA
ncbi:MAG TPA: hypothetical protein VFI54_12465 [Solirubrobacteraceae bacterium]|nr:hypothetical protein [Solirubrobacteraceae bacterium]